MPDYKKFLPSWFFLFLQPLRVFNIVIYHSYLCKPWPSSFHLTQSNDCGSFGKCTKASTAVDLEKTNFTSAFLFLRPNRKIVPFLGICKTDTWVGKVFWARDSIVHQNPFHLCLTQVPKWQIT